MEKEIYTITDWVMTGSNIYTGIEYSYYGIVCSFSTRKDALLWVKNQLNAKYEKGYYTKGNHLYRIQKTILKG